MKRAIVHCGMHKTGSSSIQNTLHGLNTAHVSYAALGAPNHSGTIAAMFLDKPENHHSAKIIGHDNRNYAQRREKGLRLFAKALSVKQDIVIVSAEVLSSASLGTLEKLHSFIVDHGRTPEYFAYVREPAGYKSSAYQQTIKKNPMAAAQNHRSYRADFEKFSKLPGAPGITLWPFAPSEFPGKSVVQDFATRLGFLDVCPPEVRTNESLSETAAKLIYIFNKTFPTSIGDKTLYKARNAMVDDLSAAFPGKSFKFPRGFITRDMIDWDDLAYLRDAFGIDFEPKVKELVPADIDKMSEAEFDTWMRKVPRDLREQLAQFMEDRGIPCPEPNRVSRMLARIYLHHVIQIARSG